MQKLQDMIDDGIKEAIYETSKDSILSDHKKFNDFLYRYFRKSHPEMYERMTSSSNQPTQLYGTAKTHFMIFQKYQWAILSQGLLFHKLVHFPITLHKK